MKIRQRINDYSEKIGNSIYNGLGDILTTDLTKKDLGILATAGAMTLATGCSILRPVPDAHKPYFGKFNPSQIDETNNRHKINVFLINPADDDKPAFQIYTQQTPNGEVGMFNLANATRIFHSNGKVQYISGEEDADGKGLYVWRQAIDQKDKSNKYLDELVLSNRKAKITRDVKNRKGIAENGNGIMTEENSTYKDIPTDNIPGLGECYILLQNQGEENIFKRMIAIPVKGSCTKISPTGKITLIHEDNIYVPSLKSHSKLEDLAKAIEYKRKFKRKKRFETEKELEELKNACDFLKELGDKDAETFQERYNTAHKRKTSLDDIDNLLKAYQLDKTKIENLESASEKFLLLGEKRQSKSLRKQYEKARKKLDKHNTPLAKPANTTLVNDKPVKPTDYSDIRSADDKTAVTPKSLEPEPTKPADDVKSKEEKPNKLEVLMKHLKDDKPIKKKE